MTQTLSTIKSLLAARGIHPRKRFGQSFLHDQNKVTAVLDAAELHEDDVILEVGPGTGVLTEAMIQRVHHVVAVEIDRDMCDILRERIGPDSGRFTLINDDVMAGKHAINEQVIAAVQRHTVEAGFKLIANLPYNIASPLLANLTADHPAMASAVVMVQREVAERIIAKPGGKDYGPISVVIQAMCELQWVTMLSPSCFWPAPQVESAVIKLVRRARPLTDDPHALTAVCQRLFSKRRKQIGSILGRDIPWPDGIEPARRPEQLSVEQIIELTHRLQ